jgi:endonuclease YncB( thermonuclease family)
VLAAGALAAAALAACSRDAGLDRLAAGEHGRVVEVVSGNTLRLDDGLDVRLAGIEAPRADDPFGPQSLAALRALAQGREVELLYGGRRRDNYGRALAQVRLAKDGPWLQRRLLEQGDARVHTWPDNRALAAVMLEAEAVARNAGRGLWSLPDYRVRLPAEVTRGWTLQLMEGRVRGARGDGALLFDAGVTAIIDHEAAADFAAAKKAPRDLLGRLVRIRGRVREASGGPEFRLDHPEQVEVLRGG